MSSRPTPPIAIAANALELQGATGRVHLLPDGEFSAIDGRPRECGAWRMDGDIAARLIAKCSARGTPRVADYEHATLRAKTTGQSAPAAGWWSTLEYEPGVGLFATGVQWTERAAAMIAAGEYRYASAVFPYDPATGAVLEILHFSLTNDPALDGLDPVCLAAASALLTPENSPMNDLMERLCYLLNLPLTTTPEEMSVQLDKLKGMLTTDPAMAAASITGLGPFVAALARQAETPDPARFVPFATYQAAQAEVAALNRKLFDTESSVLWDTAEADGRITALNRDYVESVRAKGNLAELAACLNALSPIAALTHTQTGSRAPTHVPDTGSSLEDLCKREWAVTAALNAEFLSVDNYIAYRKANEAGAIKILGNQER